MSAFSFPVFLNRDIVDFFSRSINPPIRITEADLKTIKAPTALRLYSAIWEAIMDSDADSVSQPRMDAITADFPELHETFIQTATFAMALRWLLSQAGAPDFNLMDLKDPKPKRTNKFLSALMNYYLFVCQRLEVYDEMKAQKEEEEETLGSLREANELLQRQIDDMKHDRAAQEPECTRLTQQADALETELNELVVQKRDLVQKVTDAQAKAAKATENTERTKDVIQKRKEELAAMDAQIIQSPARMKVDIENMVDKKHKVRSRQVEEQERLVEMERKMKDEDKFMKDTEAALKIVKEVSDLLDKEQSLLDSRADADSELADVQTRCSELQRHLEALEREGENRRQKQQRAAVSKQVRISSLKADIQARESALERLRDTAAQKKTEHHERLREIQNYQDDAAQKVNEEQQLLQGMKAKYAELLEALDKYHTRLASQHRTSTDKLRQCMADANRVWNQESTESSENTPPLANGNQ